MPKITKQIKKQSKHMDTRTLKALRVVLLANETTAINEVERLKKELALWKGDVKIPNEKDCWRAFNTTEDLESHGWGVVDEDFPPPMRFLGSVDDYVSYSCTRDDNGSCLRRFEYKHTDGPYYVFRLPWNIEKDGIDFNPKKGDPMVLHLKTHELHLLHPVEVDGFKVAMNPDGAGELWTLCDPEDE
mgnify:CR=1 FL=1